MLIQIGLLVIAIATMGLAWQCWELRCRCNGLALAVDHLAAHVEGHYHQHPDWPVADE